MSQRSHPPELFARWLWLVYLPLLLLAILIALKVFRVLPGWGTAPLVLLGLYSLIALRLLIERKKSGLGVPLPRRLMTGLAAISGILVLGVILFILGVERLSSSAGLAMALMGGFLMILSVTVPTFRFVDKILRFGGRVVGRSGSGPKSQREERERPRPPAPQPSPETATAAPELPDVEGSSGTRRRRSAQRLAGRSKPARRAPRHGAK